MHIKCVYTKKVKIEARNFEFYLYGVFNGEALNAPPFALNYLVQYYFKIMIENDI